MNVRRTSVGNRVLSLVLALVMVLGLVPVSAFAADAATELTSVQRIRAYAKTLLDDNYSLATDYGTNKFSWSKEDNKGYKWTYFDGLMVDAYLAMGMQANDGNILSFAGAFYDTQINESGIRAFTTKPAITGHLDSVEPARALFDLLGTVVDQDKYHTALHTVYSNLQSQTSYDSLGGNYLHKKDDTNWETYVVALDGMYMAQPFLVEYANAVASGKLENTNNIVAGDIYTAVTNRFVWVADNMLDSATGLYHHGVTEKGAGNGHFWSRSIGWYAAALVDVIELMPEGTNKTTLIGKLETLFAGMAKYQDTTTGLWYNVVNRNTNLDKNELETSGSALMAYAMLKAYNNGWNTGYGDEGIKAFEGIVTKKLNADNTQISDIYKSSGVGTTDEYYTTSSYETDEAKGVGGVLFAAIEAEKYYGSASGTVTGGVVKAPADLTVILGREDYSGVTASVTRANGAIENVSGSAMTYAMSAVTDGAATVTASYESVEIGTFAVTVTDLSTVTGSYETTVTTTETAPVFSPEWVSISTGAAEGTAKYNKVTSIAADTAFVICNTSSSKRNATVQEDTNGVLTFTTSQQITWTEDSNGTYTPSETPITFWYLDESGHLYTVNSQNVKYYLTDVSNLSTDSTSAITFTITVIDATAATCKLKGNDDKNYQPKSKGFESKAATSGNDLTLYAPAASVTEFAKLNGQNYTISTSDNKTCNAMITQIQSDCGIVTSDTAEGTGTALENGWSNTEVKTSWDKTLDPTAAGTYTMTVSYKDKPLGSIVVVVNGEQTVSHTVTLSLTPNALTLDLTGTTTGTLTAAITVDGAAGTGTVEWTSAAPGVATVESGTVTAVAAGSASVQAKLSAVTVDGAPVTLTAPITAEVTVTVTDSSVPVTEPATTPEPTPTTTPKPTTVPAETTPAETMEITVGGAGAGSGTVAKNGTLQLSVTGVTGGSTTWSSDNKSVATVDGNGLVTGVAAGTATITAIWTAAQANGIAAYAATNDTQTATFTVTVTDAAATGNVTVTTPATSGGDLTAPAFTSEGYKLVKDATTGTGTTTYTYTYTKITTLDGIGDGDQFVIVDAASGTVALKNNNGTKANAAGSITGDTWSFTDAADASGSMWTFTASNTNWRISNGSYSLRNDAKVLGENQSAVSTVYLDSNFADGKFSIVLDSTSVKRHLVYTSGDTSGEWNRNDSGDHTGNLYLFKVSSTTSGGDGTPAVYGKLTSTANTGFAYTVSTTTADAVKTAIQNGFTVYEASDSTGTGETQIAWTPSRITLVTTGLNVDAVGEYQVSVELDGVEIGKVPVKIVAAGTEAVTNTYTVTMQAPGDVSVVAGKTQAVTLAAPTATLNGADVTVNSYTVTWSSNDETVATVNEKGEITGVKAGSTTVTGKLTAITFAGESGTQTQIADTLQVTVPVTVTAAPVSGDETYVRKSGAVENGKEYLIGWDNGNGTVTLMQVTNLASGSKRAARYLTVTPNAAGQITLTPEEGKISRWTFSTHGDPYTYNGDLFDNYAMSNSAGGTDGKTTWYVGVDAGNPLTTGINSSFVHMDATTGNQYALAGDVGSGGSRDLYWTGTAWEIGSRDKTYKYLYLYEKGDNPSSVTLPETATALVGGTAEQAVTLTPTVRYNDETLTAGGYTLTWQSSDESVLTVVDGVLTAKKAGTATVTATLATVDGTAVTENITASTVVTVRQPVFNLSESTLEAVIGGLTVKSGLSVMLNGAAVTNYTLAWSSSDATIATVDANGEIKAVAEGEATITATLMTVNGVDVSGLNLTDVVVVTTYAKAITGATLSPAALSFPVEETSATVDAALANVTLTLTYNDGSDPKTVKLKTETNTDGFTLSAAIATGTVGSTDYAVSYDGAERAKLHVAIVPKVLSGDGVVEKELSVTYELCTDGIVAGEEYIIVAIPDETLDSENKMAGIAFANPDDGNDKSKAVGTPVTISSDKRTLTVTGSDAYIRWLFSGSAPKYSITNANRILRCDNTNYLTNSQNSVTLGTVVTVDEESGIYAFRLHKSDARYLSYTDASGFYLADKVASDAVADINTEAKLYLYKRVAVTEPKAVTFGVEIKAEPTDRKKTDADNGTYYVFGFKPDADTADPTVTVNGTATTNYTIEWSSSDTSVATVDENGKITAVFVGDETSKSATATITARLVTADGMPVAGIDGGVVEKTLRISVELEEVSYSISGSPVRVRLHGEPDYSNVALNLVCNLHGNRTIYPTVDYSAEIDMVDVKTGKMRVNTDVPGTYKVPIRYNGEIVTDGSEIVTEGSENWLMVEVIVDESPYYGLETQYEYAEFPDPGAVRINKWGTGGQDFQDTGVVNVELAVAGVSTKSNVDVILVADVSNSMAWSMDWFNDNPSATADKDKIPTGDNPDKLDMAMQYAGEFADLLLGDNTDTVYNTLSFVTFAGYDKEHTAAATTNVDSVMTVFTGVKSAEEAKKSFNNTKFYEVTPGTDTTTCKLQIAGTDGAVIASGTNRGNTNYDYAFGQAIAAVEELKAAYETANPGKTYDESGRELHVIFMTDGAASHYNGDRNGGSTNDTLWNEPTKKYDYATYTDAAWLTKLNQGNEMATKLDNSINGELHVVGFDLAHGGFTGFTGTPEGILAGLRDIVQNKAVDCVQADNPEALNQFFRDLAAALTYAGTDAVVTDVIGSDFTLYTGVQGGGRGGTKEENSRITISAYKLYQTGDIGKTITLDDGTTKEVTANMVGNRTGEERQLAYVWFKNGGTEAYSSAVDGGATNILTTDATGATTITGKYFTYTKTAGGVETFEWKLDSVTDEEYVLSYYAYLTGSWDNELERAAGLYPTNEGATLQYVDISEKYAQQVFPVPNVAWGSANIGVRFFLVNEAGQYVNRAGDTFDNPANRVFLPQRAYYGVPLSGTTANTVTASDALAKAGLTDSCELYDTGASATVLNDPSGNGGGKGYVTGTITGVTGKANTVDIMTVFDLAGTNNYQHAIVEVPVIWNNLGMTTIPENDVYVVMDFSSPVRVITIDETNNPFAQREKIKSEDGNDTEQDAFTTELVGFHAYDASHDPYAYVSDKYYADTLTTDCGTFTLVTEGSGDTAKVTGAKFTPSKPLTGVVKAFYVVKLTHTTNTEGIYYLTGNLTVVPATVVHYETTDNMSAAFATTDSAAATADSTKGTWTTVTDGTAAGAAQSNENKSYGFDSSYADCSKLSGGSSLFVNNQSGSAKDKSTVEFSFTGTGIDIISRTGARQGLVKLTLKGKTTGIARSVSVLNKGLDELYQIPVISVENLPYDTYTAKLEVYCESSLYGGQFYLDAVKVYGGALESTIIGSTTVGSLYETAGESAPQFIKIRDILLGNNNFGDVSIETTEVLNSAVYIDGNSNLGDTSTNFNNYDKIGPNNEVYLGNNQAVAFKLRASDLNKLPGALAIGLKSANGSPATAKITVYYTPDGSTSATSYTHTVTVNTSTAMFYDILGSENIATFLGTSNEFCVVISNTGTGTLSVTDLKVGYGAAKGSVDTVVDINAVSLTQETLNQSAQVVSVSVNQEKEEGSNYVAYAMHSTTLVVVTGQDAQSIQITDANNNVLGATATYVDSANGARRWRVLVRFTDIGNNQKFTVTGIGSSGQAHTTKGNITLNVQYYAPTSAATNN